MRSNTSLLGRVIFWIASEMLEILTKILRIIFNENLCAPCVPWIFGGLLRKKSSVIQGGSKRIDVTPKSWTVYLICFDVVSCIVQDSCRA